MPLSHVFDNRTGGQSKVVTVNDIKQCKQYRLMAEQSSIERVNDWTVNSAHVQIQAELSEQWTESEWGNSVIVRMDKRNKQSGESEWMRSLYEWVRQ